MPGGGFFVYADSSRFSRDSERVLPRRARGAASRSRRASTSARTAPSEHVRFAYTIELREARGRRRAARALSRRPADRAIAAGPCSATLACSRCLVAGDRRAALPGCGTIDFYWQGVAGQVDLLARARPIDEVLGDDRRPELADRLAARAGDPRVREPRARPAGQRQLHALRRPRPAVRRLERVRRAGAVAGAAAVVLPGRRAASATAATSPRPTRGPRPRASRRRATTSTSAACRPTRRSASSTTRCCRRSSAIRETELARLVFHELAHQVVYVKDDTHVQRVASPTAVEEEGVARWLAAQAGTPGACRAARRAARAASGCARASGASSREARARARGALRERCADEDKRARARRRSFARDARRLRAREGGRGGPRRRTTAGSPGTRGAARTTRASPPSGSTTTSVPAFRALLADEGGDLPAFYARVRELARLPRSQRDAALASLASRSPPVALHAFRRFLG